MGWFLAALSGILAGFSYPTVFKGYPLPNLGILAFLAWVPLFQALKKVSPGRAFLLSGFAAVFHYALSMYWIYTALNTFGGLSPTLSLFSLGVLILALSAYFGSIFLLSQWLAERLAISVNFLRPFLWVGIEYLRGHVPAGGLPWSQIAYSQGSFLAFIQSADLVGLYGVTFLLVLVNEGLSQLLSLARRETSKSAFYFSGGVLLLVILNLAYGKFRLHETLPAPDSFLKTGVVQGNIPQDQKWNRAFVEKILETYHQGTLELQARGAQLVVWPEASFPSSFYYDAEDWPVDREGMNVDLLFGALTRSRNGSLGNRRTLYNSALLMDREGRPLDYYHKRHLVPFGEYVPWKELLFFAKKLTAEVGDISPGESYRPLQYRNQRLGVLICYEDIFPEISRAMVEQGANALVNISNDAWYGFSSAAYQHQVFSQYRAVETRRVLIRATNTGLSSLIDRHGKVLWQGELFQRQDFLSDLPLYHDRSLYVRIGDVFPVVCLALSGVALLGGIIKRKRICPKN